jgi:hypothetical protein
MHLMLARSAVTIAFAAVLANANPDPKYRPFVEFEAPRSIGTPIDELARIFGGPGLADRIAGRLRLDTDGSLSDTARQLIRYKLAQGS